MGLRCLLEGVRGHVGRHIVRMDAMGFGQWGAGEVGAKKRAPLSPTFVNLKSNTMKNTLQRYALLANYQTIQEKKAVL